MPVSYAIADAADVDAAELAGIPSNVAFILGAEWAMFRFNLDGDRRPFVQVVHQLNVPRLKNLCTRRGRSVTSRTVSKDWAELSVGAEGAN